MSIKDFFYKKEVVLEDMSKITSSVESGDLIEQIRIKNKKFIPDIDFSNPKNFARFGSAKEYYNGSIKRIYEQYPYDGSEAEKLEFYNNSTYLDQWLFDNKYPKSTGYAIFSAGLWGSGTTEGKYGVPATPSYIHTAGSIHTASIYQYTASQGIGSLDLKNAFDKGVLYDADKNRTHGFRVKPTDGVTIQFWLKKSAFSTTKTDREVILDLWNGETVPDGTTAEQHNYGRLTLEISGGLSNPTPNGAVLLTLQSGSVKISEQRICKDTYNAAAIANNAWQHHTVTIKSSGALIIIKYYLDGLLNQTSQYTTAEGIGEIPGKIDSFIGGLQTRPSGSTYASKSMVGAGKLSASMDDFRYWKKDLDAEFIKNTWFYPIGGGANSDDNRTNLGIYYKFNEGIVSNSYYDATVLDYSGRISNGNWVGYSSSFRNTGSAFQSSSLGQVEIGDPIIRIDHVDVKSLITEMNLSGSDYDKTNTSRLYDAVPQWIREEDSQNSNINYLFQIMSSYFDTLYAQIKEMPRLKEKNYFSGSSVPHEFVDRLLSEKGILVPNSFVSADILSLFWQRDRNNTYYEEDIEKIKRLIYYNIYNNIDFILKSKGTESSFRNMLRCFGIDDELVKLNIYTDNGTHYLTDRYKNSSVKSRFVNFNNPTSFAASVTQTSSSINSLTYVSGSEVFGLEKNNAFTLEGDVIFPSKFKLMDDNYFVTSFLTSSIFGFHEANTSDATDYTFGGSNEANLQLYAVRDFEESSTIKFVVRNGSKTVNLESKFFDNVYEDQRWNFSLSIQPKGYPYVDSYLSSSQNSYNVELYGVTYNNEEVKHEFAISASVNSAVGLPIMTKAKRVYVGANKTNFTGSVIYSSDVKIGSIRMWMDKLSKEAIKEHNKDPKNYGHNKISDSPTVFTEQISNRVEIPAMDSLILHWNFDQNENADAAGKFIVEDFSSGSTKNQYGWASNILERENKGLGLGFFPSTKVVENNFIFARRKELPEISFIDDKVIIMNDERELFIEDDDTTDNVFSLEKSMNQSISEEMLRTFSLMKEYANLFAKPVDYYRQEYKRLRKARSLFFERTAGNPDFEKFTEYFKWIDSSLSFFMEQLKPASVTFTEGVNNVVESHIFERPKYTRKFPRIKNLASTQGQIRGISELSYNWKFGHSPEYKGLTDENIHCLWKKEREERSDIAGRETIRKILRTKTEGYIKRFGDPANMVGNKQTAYIAHGYAEAVRRFSKPYKLFADIERTIHGGTNYNKNKNREFVYDAVRPHGAKTNLGIPVNVVVVGVGPGQGLIDTNICNDIEDPNEMVKYNFRMTVGKDASGDGLSPATASLDLVYEVKSNYGSPFNLISGSVADGANRAVNSNYLQNAILTNLHSDTTDHTNEIPMQGPFTETWVGGHQSRHVPINRHKSSLSTLNKLDGQYTRPEAFRILFGEHPDETVQDGAIGIVGPDYGGPYPDITRQFAVYYRGLRTKRPYNIQNIQGDEYRQGNYTRKYEYFNTVGRQENNSRFKKAASELDYEISGVFLPTQIRQALPETTHPLSLVGIAASDRGNTFGVGESNRINAHLETFFPEYLGTGSFQVTGATQYLAPYSASIEVEPIPVANTHAYITFKVDGIYNGLTNNDHLELTASGLDKLVEVDTDGTYTKSPDMTIETYRRAIRCQTTAFAVTSKLSGYSGVGSSWSVSLWVKNNDGGDPANAFIRFADGSIVGNGTSTNHFGKNPTSDFVHEINFDDDIVVQMSSSAGLARAGFNTNIRDNTWHHVVVSFPLSGMGTPLLWLDGSPQTLTGSYSSIGGTTKAVSQFSITVDDLIAYQDVVVWDKILDNTDVTELYNSGDWRSPADHTDSSDIIDWYQFGNDDYLRVSGFKVGDILGNTTKISSSFGSGGNTLDSFYNGDGRLLIEGKGNQTNDEIWGQLTSSLNSNFSGYTATFISGSTNAQFFVRKDSAGTTQPISVSETGGSFFSLTSGSGTTAVASDLEDGDTITIDGKEFTVAYTTSGSAATDLVVGSSYRKAFHFKDTGDAAANQLAIYNLSYANPTSNNIGLSFWVRPKKDDTQHKYLCYFQNASSDDALEIKVTGSTLTLMLAGPGGEENQYIYTGSLPTHKWTSVALSIDTTNVGTPPSLYLNGGLKAASSTVGSYSSALEDLRRFVMGDRQYELCGELQDFVVWNTGLNSQDAKILHNSGSWFDIFSHASASHIWDWWMLGSEIGTSYNSGSNLSTNSISAVAPTIGRHTLTLGSEAGAKVFVSDGIFESGSNTNFWNETTQSFKDNTLLTGSYTVSSVAKFYLTASTVPHTGTFSLAENGDTFDITVAPFRGPDNLTTNNGGAVDDHYVQIGSTKFYVDADNSNAGGNYAKVGDHYYVYSSGSSDQFWTRLSGAVSTQFTNYVIATSSTGVDTSVFSLTASTAPDPGYAITSNGASYSNLVQPILPSTQPVVESGLINVIERESDFLTGSTRNKTVITSRFSAPGGIEVQTYGYLDAYAREYSVHNNLNYKNLSVRGSGSGENGTIRVNSHANTRDGLRTLYQRPMGRGGIDSVYESMDDSNYELTASYHKVPRNTLVSPRSGSSVIEIVERSNNYNYQSTIPSSDYNYSWVTSSLGNIYNVRTGAQKVFGYWPKDGINKVNGVFDSAITFPSSAADIFPDLSTVP